MIKVISSQITIGDAAIVCNKTIDFSKFLEKYSELTKKMIEETIVQSGMKVDEAKALLLRAMMEVATYGCYFYSALK